MEQSPFLASRFARGNWWISLLSQPLASLEAIALSVSFSQFIRSLLLNLSLRSRKLVDQSPFLASRFARDNWLIGLPSKPLASLEEIG